MSHEEKSGVKVISADQVICHSQWACIILQKEWENSGSRTVKDAVKKRRSISEFLAFRRVVKSSFRNSSTHTEFWSTPWCPTRQTFRIPSFVVTKMSLYLRLESFCAFVWQADSVRRRYHVPHKSGDSGRVQCQGGVAHTSKAFTKYGKHNNGVTASVLQKSEDPVASMLSKWWQFVG